MPQVNGTYRPNIGAARIPAREEDAKARAQDFRAVDTGYTKEDAIAEANRCLNCKKPLCVMGCPVGINIPAFIEKIRMEDFGGALDIMKAGAVFSWRVVRERPRLLLVLLGLTGIAVFLPWA